jgi:hypothetical protein
MKKFGFRAFRPPKGMFLIFIFVAVIDGAEMKVVFSVSRYGYATLFSFPFHSRDS